MVFGGSAAVGEGESSAPASAVDRVMFPKDYRESWVIVRSIYRQEQKRVVNVYANERAAAVVSKNGLPYPYGSIFVMETSQVGAPPTRTERGWFVGGDVVGLHVMRREKGFGEGYGPNRTGEWEYVEYRPDGTFITPPAQSATCAACHVKAGAARDWVYRGRFDDESKTSEKSEMK